ncbi:LPXTG cell wall anchor domain-containing protein [Pelagerythrobacter aerophilus]|uniref:LPXTG cell wall anchor domain-containing protein n=1 Tax=Pelagerythrobacter aerophilus TaxID=2306995 RepID=UPI0011C44FD6|nr:LPXTG cell wall anchor domain-containing protein [Pelagerythrobacter aerophilus]
MDIRTSVSAAVLALALATPSLAQQTGSVRDFRLPPDPDATPTPEVQGPVDPEAEVRTTPRVIPTDTPTTSTPTPTPTPTLTLPASRSTPARPAPADTPRSQPQPAPETAPTATPSPSPTAATDEPAPQPTEFAPSIPPTASVPPATIAEPPESGSSMMIWLAALIAALGLAGGAFWYLRRREALAPVPVIEPPLVRRETPPPQPDGPAPATGEAPAPRPAPPPPPVPGRTSGPPVTLHALPVRVSKSMMNATFAFRLTLENQSMDRWEGVSIEADLVTAHGSAPIGEQVADPATALAPLSTLEALEPGDSTEIAGEVRLPLGQVRAIPQGRAAVYVPLLRVRLTASGKQPIARTFLVGQLPDRQGGRLRPFRLDEMPQSYNAIGLRPLD